MTVDVKKTGRRAASTKLDKGEHSIDRNTPTKRVLKGREVIVLDWSVRDMAGKLHTRRSQGASITEARNKAKKAAKAILETGGKKTDWRGTDQMTRFIDEVSLPSIIEHGYRPTSVSQYKRSLSYLRSELAGYSIADAWHYDRLADALYAIAAAHSAEQARQARTVLGLHVGQPLKRYRLATGNPIEGAKLDLAKHAPAQTGDKRGGVALSPEEQERVISYLLALDPADGVVDVIRGRWKGIPVKQRRNAIDLTLLHAGTGIRIKESLMLERRDVIVDGDLMFIDVRKEVAKTHIPRRAAVLDPRIQKRLAARLEETKDLGPNAPLIGGPANPSKRWTQNGSSGAADQIRDLYPELAAACDAPALDFQRSHVWRTTLNARMEEAGISLKARAAQLGHGEAVNQSNYTAGIDMVGLSQAYRERQAADSR